jgi:hypothetical protein
MTNARVAAALSLAIGFAFPAAADAQRVEGAFTRTLLVSGPVDLEVTAGSGSIEVRRGAAGRIEVSARVRAGSWGFNRGGLSNEERVRRIEADPPIEQTAARVRIGRIEDEELQRNVSISYTLTVPADTSLVSTTGSGSHRIEGVGGRIEVTSGSGSIRIRDAGGDVKVAAGSGSIVAASVGGSFAATTGSGSITGEDVRGGIVVKAGSGSINVSSTGPGDVDASSGSGSIALTGIEGGLRASTGSGALRVQGQQTSDWRLTTASGGVTIDLDGTPAFALDARSSSGRIETAFAVDGGSAADRRERRGVVNGGGPLLQVRTGSGGIRIR